MKHYNLVEKMYLYRKKNDVHNFPFDLISRKNTQNSIYNINNIIKTNNHIKINGNNNLSKINNSSMNNNTAHFIKKHIINPKFTYNNINTNKNNTHIIANNLKMANIIKNRYNYNNSNKNNKTSNRINVGKFFVHTLNANEKDYLGKRISVSNPKKAENNKDYKNEINALIKERDEKQNLVKKQKKLIEKIEEDNKKLEKEIKKIHDENNKIKQKIELSQDNQEQLIVLVKIIQKNGVNVEELIDKWNEEVDMENQKNNDNNSSNNNNESFNESNNEVNSHIDSSSFIPINIEKPHVNKKVFNGIPKLNFDIIKSNHKNHKREKYRNKSK